MTVPRIRPVVVCVDDEPAVLASLRRSLRNESYDVLTTAAPEDVLEWTGTRNVSLVISDQRMPGMTGVELMGAICRRSPGTARILLTAYPETVLDVDRVGLRIERVILKPWNDLELRRIIRRLVDPGDPDSEPAADAASAGEGVPSEGTELVTRIDCGGRTTAEVLDPIARSCTRFRSGGERPIVQLLDLGSLADSLAGLLKGLAQLADEAGTTITIYDDSGYVRTYLGAVGGSAPLDLRSRRSE